MALLRAVAVVLVFGGSLCSQETRASDSPGAWQTRPYHYVAIDQDYRTVFQEFGREFGIPVKVSDRVVGSLREDWGSLSAASFLDRVCESASSTWYYDGSIITVTRASESRSVLLPLHGVSLAGLRSALNGSHLLDNNVVLKDGPTADLAVASGPPHYLDIVQQTATDMAGSAPSSRQPSSPRGPENSPRTVVVMRGAATTVVVPSDVSNP